MAGEEGVCTNIFNLEEDGTGSLYLPITVNGFKIMALMDSGSTCTIIHPDIFEKIHQKDQVNFDGIPTKLRMANGNITTTQGKVNLKIKIGDDHLEHKFIVAPVDTPVILGFDFFKQKGCILDMDLDTLFIKETATTQKCNKIQNMPSVFRISLAETIKVPHRSEIILPTYIKGTPHFNQGVIECRKSQNFHFFQKSSIFNGRNLVFVEKSGCSIYSCNSLQKKPILNQSIHHDKPKKPYLQADTRGQKNSGCMVLVEIL